MTATAGTPDLIRMARDKENPKAFITINATQAVEKTMKWIRDELGEKKL